MLEITYLNTEPLMSEITYFNTVPLMSDITYYNTGPLMTVITHFYTAPQCLIPLILTVSHWCQRSLILTLCYWCLIKLILTLRRWCLRSQLSHCLNSCRATISRRAGPPHPSNRKTKQYLTTPLLAIYLYIGILSTTNKLWVRTGTATITYCRSTQGTAMTRPSALTTTWQQKDN